MSTGDDTALAKRLRDALARIEAAHAAAAARADELADLRRRHAALRAEARAAVEAMDGLLADG